MGSAGLAWAGTALLGCAAWAQQPGVATALSATAQTITQLKITAPTPTASAAFGSSLLIAGDTMVVGAGSESSPGASFSGAVYIYRRAGNAWVLAQRLTAPTPQRLAIFGASIAISGDTLAIAAPGTGDGSGPAPFVHIFRRDTTGAWRHEAALRPPAGGWGLGRHVGLDGDVMAVSANLDDGAAGERVGAVHVFVRSGGQWAYDGRISDATKPEYGEWPEAVAVRQGAVFIGSAGDPTPRGVGRGRVQVWERGAQAWALTGSVSASDGDQGDAFGVRVKFFGESMIVGAPFDDIGGVMDAGSAYVFTRSGATWAQQGKLTAATPAASDWFGYAVAGAGDSAIVGSERDDTARGIDSGSATLFSRSPAGVWTRGVQLTAFDGRRDDWFGATVAAGNGRFAVGAYVADLPPLFNCGAVYPY